MKPTMTLRRALTEISLRADKSIIRPVEEFGEGSAYMAVHTPVASAEESTQPTGSDASLVADCLRDMLGEIVDADTDSIGHLLPIVSGSSYAAIVPAIVEAVQRHHSMTTLAKNVIQAAVVLGPHRASDLLESWLSGDPRKLRMMAILTGVAVGGGCELHHGIRLSTLPTSSEELPKSMPDLDDPVAISQILGRTLLEVDATINPVFFAPTRDRRGSAKRVSTALGQHDLETFSLALSLVIRQRVELAWAWTDHEEAEPFSSRKPRVLMGRGIAPVQATERSLVV